MHERVLAVFAAFLGGLSMLLVAVGLYGVLGYAVVRRTREIGVRLALGSSRAGVIRMVLCEIGVTSAVGIACGLAAGLMAARLARALWYGVRPQDANSLLLPLAIMIVATLAATLPPGAPRVTAGSSGLAAPRLTTAHKMRHGSEDLRPGRARAQGQAGSLRIRSR